MAYYCGECIVWRSSGDENKYGERWCAYSRRYERSDQNIYGCKGFLYAGRAVLTKVCEILDLDMQPWFAAFDRVKEAYLVPKRMDLLVSYCGVAPKLTAGIERDDDKKALAKQLLDEYLIPARRLSEHGMYKEAVDVYRTMIRKLTKCYEVARGEKYGNI